MRGKPEERTRLGKIKAPPFFSRAAPTHLPAELPLPAAPSAEGGTRRPRKTGPQPAGRPACLASAGAGAAAEPAGTCGPDRGRGRGRQGGGQGLGGGHRPLPRHFLPGCGRRSGSSAFAPAVAASDSAPPSSGLPPGPAAPASSAATPPLPSRRPFLLSLLPSFSPSLSFAAQDRRSGDKLQAAAR